MGTGRRLQLSSWGLRCGRCCVPHGRSSGRCRFSLGMEPRLLPASLGDGITATVGFPWGRSRGRCRLRSGAEPRPLLLPLSRNRRLHWTTRGTLTGASADTRVLLGVTSKVGDNGGTLSYLLPSLDRAGGAGKQSSWCRLEAYQRWTLVLAQDPKSRLLGCSSPSSQGKSLARPHESSSSYY